MKTLGQVLAHPKLYRAALASADEALRILPHFVIANRFNTWTSKGREMPAMPRGTFHDWWKQHRMNNDRQS
jgi:L-lactate dehydrogenase complex protein LldF